MNGTGTRLGNHQELFSSHINQYLKLKEKTLQKKCQNDNQSSPSKFRQFSLCSESLTITRYLQLCCKLNLSHLTQLVKITFAEESLPRSCKDFLEENDSEIMRVYRTHFLQLCYWPFFPDSCQGRTCPRSLWLFCKSLSPLLHPATTNTTRSMSPYGITLPQWVNSLSLNKSLLSSIL